MNVPPLEWLGAYLRGRPLSQYFRIIHILIYFMHILRVTSKDKPVAFFFPKTLESLEGDSPLSGNDVHKIKSPKEDLELTSSAKIYLYSRDGMGIFERNLLEISCIFP